MPTLLTLYHCFKLRIFEDQIGFQILVVVLSLEFHGNLIIDTLARLEDGKPSHLVPTTTLARKHPLRFRNSNT